MSASVGVLINNPVTNWRCTSQQQAVTDGREIPASRGKQLGGSSAIHGLVYLRRQPLGYDIWVQRGNRRRSYNGALPLFQRLENDESADGAQSLASVPIQSTRAAQQLAINCNF